MAAVASAPLTAGVTPHRHMDAQRLEVAYRLHAPVYDVASAIGDEVRRQAVDALDLRPGEVVLDIGCGTGLNFAGIRDRIGPTGRLVGVDLSATMLARAHARVAHNGWENVTLVESPVGRLDLDVQADSALLCLVHDVMRCPAALERVVRHLRSGGRIVAAGAKWGPWWAPAINVATWCLNRPYVATFEGFVQPWDQLERLVIDLRVQLLSTYLGAAYLARATRP